MMRLVLLITVAVASAAGCQVRQLTPAEQEQWTHDSLNYEVRLATWMRDSTVIDSISRTVNTDSLYRLFHVALRPQPLVPMLRALDCERRRLSTRHGSLPVDAAIERMNDTLWRGVKKSDVDAMNGRLNTMTTDDMIAMGSGQYDCHITSNMRTLNGTDLVFTMGHPAPPVRPGGH